MDCKHRAAGQRNVFVSPVCANNTTESAFFFSQCGPGSPGTYFADQAELELRDLPVLLSNCPVESANFK